MASVVALATVGAACATAPGEPPPPPEQPVYDWLAKAHTLHVVDDNNDNYLCDGINLNCDEPYLFHLAFRAQYGVPGSATTWLVHDRPNELKCPGSPPAGIGLDADSCKSGESTAVPAAQGEILFQDLKASDFVNLLFGDLPEVAGFITFAFEEDILSNGSPDATLLQELVRTLLDEIVVKGNIPVGDGSAAAADQAAVAILNDLMDLFGEFLTSTAIELLTEVGLFDDFVGLTPTVIAAVDGFLADVLETVEVDGQSLQQIPVLNGNVFTTDAPASFTSIYTQQVVNLLGVNIPIGDDGTRYDIDWTVGRP